MANYILDLRLKEHRLKAISLLELVTLQTLCNAGVELAADTVIIAIHQSSVCFGIAATGERKEKGYKAEWCSDFDIFTVVNEELPIMGRIKNGITLSALNFDCSKDENPNDFAIVKRCFNVTEMLRNWDAACRICNAASAAYVELSKACQNVDAHSEYNPDVLLNQIRAVIAA